MTTENEKYVESFRLWEKGQLLNLKQIEVGIENSSKMVEVHSKTLDVLNETYQHELKYLDSQLACFEQWKKDHGIEEK